PKRGRPGRGQRANSRRVEIERTRFDLADLDVPRVDIAPDYRFELGLLFVDLLAIHLDLAEHLSQLELCLGDILLISAPDPVAGFSDLFDSREFGAILHEHR